MLRLILKFICLFIFVFSFLNQAYSQDSMAIYTIEKEMISTKKAAGLVEKYYEPKTDMLSLLFDRPHPTCLQIMKELRLQEKKTKDPLACWKLLQVISSEEIYFETFYQRPSNTYVMHKLVKHHDLFYHTTLLYEGKHPGSKVTSDFLKVLQKTT
jgi:hypothetical protein